MMSQVLLDPNRLLPVPIRDGSPIVAGFSSLWARVNYRLLGD